MSATYEGGCHCGAIRWKFQTRLDPGEWPVRACQCSFCRRHSARCTSDPDGSVEIYASDEGALQRYRFEMSTADFLVCRNCGTYLGAVLGGSGERFATLNLNCMESEARGLPDAVPVSYTSEDRQQRIERRRSKWTPVATFM